MNELGRGTLVLCPNLWGARAFRYGAKDQDVDTLEFVKEYPRPKIRTVMEDFPDPDDVDIERVQSEDDLRVERLVALRFMRFLANEVERECEAKNFDDIILCAEARILDVLLKSLSECAKKRIVGTIPLDLYEANETDLINYVKDIKNKVHYKGVSGL